MRSFVRMAEDKVRVALALLQQAGRIDLVRPEVLAARRPARRASVGVAAAVLPCSPPRPGLAFHQRSYTHGPTIQASNDLYCATCLKTTKTVTREATQSGV
ncbi:hypothetical protein NDU88_006281 [Pleurodeles waltl]|uniref:Uncharacterized protein n=1 Tax=Pleurodeles waltl TaxID=8319 RepID=A0AAV7SPE2_PLEWA|nr:hypothetical protein NDU88_006281 [Pleurodeles waltl]